MVAAVVMTAIVTTMVTAMAAAVVEYSKRLISCLWYIESLCVKQTLKV
jgi:hypothetical protein